MARSTLLGKAGGITSTMLAVGIRRGHWTLGSLPRWTNDEAGTRDWLDPEMAIPFPDNAPFHEGVAMAVETVLIVGVLIAGRAGESIRWAVPGRHPKREIEAPPANQTWRLLSSDAELDNALDRTVAGECAWIALSGQNIAAHTSPPCDGVLSWPQSVSCRKANDGRRACREASRFETPPESGAISRSSARGLSPWVTARLPILVLGGWSEELT